MTKCICFLWKNVRWYLDDMFGSMISRTEKYYLGDSLEIGAYIHSSNLEEGLNIRVGTLSKVFKQSTEVSSTASYTVWVGDIFWVLPQEIHSPYMVMTTQLVNFEHP